MQLPHIILYKSKLVHAPEYTFRNVTRSIDEHPRTKYALAVEDLKVSGARPAPKPDMEIDAITPVIPIQLIKPMAMTTGAMDLGEDNIAWGIKAVNAHLSPFTGKGVKVAVLDTGIDKGHPCFKDIDIISEDFTGEGIMDTDGHGTHCSGTIFGRDTESMRIGVARGVEKVYIGKVIGKNGSNTATIMNAIQWAVNQGVHVISMSIGIDFPGFVASLVAGGMKPEPATSLALEGYRKNILLFEKIASFVRTASLTGNSQPALLIAAAGNESKRPEYEISVSPPAVSDGFISVGALGKKQDAFFMPNFSNTNPKLSAPGVDIPSAQAGGRLCFKSGTSMATPHVAGVAALWVEKMIARNQFTIDQLSANLTVLSSDKGLDGIDPKSYGAGIVQAPI